MKIFNPRAYVARLERMVQAGGIPPAAQSWFALSNRKRAEVERIASPELIGLLGSINTAQENRLANKRFIEACRDIAFGKSLGGEQSVFVNVHTPRGCLSVPMTKEDAKQFAKEERQKRRDYEVFLRQQRNQVKPLLPEANKGLPKQAQMHIAGLRMPTVGITTLKARGWTEKLITQLIGEPYTMATNPHYISGPKRRLWLISVVIEAEAEHLAALRRKLGRGVAS